MSLTPLAPATSVVLLLTALVSAQSRESETGKALRADRESVLRRTYVCGTRPNGPLRGLGLEGLGPLSDGKPLYYRQTPAVIRPDISTSIRVDVTVLGDVPSLRFKRNDPEKGSPTETWTRTRTGVARGRVVSFFAKSWPASEFARVLRRYIHGYDYPEIFWGQVLGPGSTERFGLLLRVGFTNLPSSPVNRIGDTVQYSSHVVNLVIPDYGDSRITGGDYAFDEEAVAREFYEHFQDIYHVLTITPQFMHFAPFGAFHVQAKNEVRGINISSFNRSALYGSSGALEGVEVFAQAEFAEHYLANHELTHQWGHDLNWAAIAGIKRGGDSPAVHAPLMAFGETMIGAVLEPTRRVEASPKGGYEIERQAFPARQHPIDMYLMGKLDASQVPDVLVFENQSQFETSGDEPEVGTKLKGAALKVTIDDIVRQHGPRSGPVPGVYRRALIYVSRTLATQDEMNYLNFLAQRQGDPRRLGVMSYDGIASFDVTTRKTVDLKTDISPLAAPKLTKNLPVDFPAFGKADWRGVVFDKVVPGRYTVGSTVRLSGKVTATDRTDFDQISIIFDQVGDEANSVRFDAPVSRAGLFSMDIRFASKHKGSYWMEVLLFWDGASPQHPRSLLSPVHVQ